jgi:hypothetical protein
LSGKDLWSLFKPLRKPKAAALAAVALWVQMPQRRRSWVFRSRRSALRVWRLKKKPKKIQQAER